jgi:uncharacterized protein YdeI (YjbR/CyaY-like superfamily)
MSELKINNLEELKYWLEQNYAQKESVWLVFPKKSAGANFAWSEIVDVLLCYGWIDSLPRKVDENHTSIRIGSRNPKSNWSKVNKDKITVLQAKNLIHPNGHKSIQTAKENGAWDALNEVDSLILPKDFEQYLFENSLVDGWNAKSKTFKRGFLEQLLNSKRPETRLKKMQTLKF